MRTRNEFVWIINMIIRFATDWKCSQAKCHQIIVAHVVVRLVFHILTVNHDDSFLILCLQIYSTPQSRIFRAFWQWSRKLFLACRTKCSAGHFEPMSDIFPSYWLVNISGHSCFPCRTFYVYWTLLDKMSGKVWTLCWTSAEGCRTCPGIFRDHWKFCWMCVNEGIFYLLGWTVPVCLME